MELDWTNPTKPNGNLTYLVKVTGAFYRDPSRWDFSTIVEERTLLETVEYGKHTISNLLPFSQYNIYVLAVNSKGLLKSNAVPVSLPAGSEL